MKPPKTGAELPNKETTRQKTYDFTLPEESDKIAFFSNRYLNIKNEPEPWDLEGLVIALAALGLPR